MPFHPQEALDKCRKIHPTKPSRVGIHKSHIPQTATSYLSLLPVSISHTHRHLMLQISIPFQIAFLPPLHNDTQGATLPRPTFTSKRHVFFNMKYHIYCSLTCATLCYNFTRIFYILCVPLKILSVVLLTSFFLQALCLLSAVIFRNTCQIMAKLTVLSHNNVWACLFSHTP